MIDEKPPNPVADCGGKPKDQSDEKPPNLMGDWGRKQEDRWKCAVH